MSEKVSECAGGACAETDCALAPTLTYFCGGYRVSGKARHSLGPGDASCLVYPFVHSYEGVSRENPRAVELHRAPLPYEPRLSRLFALFLLLLLLPNSLCQEYMRCKSLCLCMCV